jgi:hypothetical protein
LGKAALVMDSWQRRKRDPLGVTIGRIKAQVSHSDWLMAGSLAR